MYSILIVLYTQTQEKLALAWNLTKNGQVLLYSNYSTYLEMEFAVDSLVLVIDHFKSVAAVTIHVTITIGNTSVTE